MRIVTVEKFFIDEMRKKIFANEEYKELRKLSSQLKTKTKKKDATHDEIKEQYDKLGGEERRLQLLKEMIKDMLVESKGNDIVEATFLSSMKTPGGLMKQVSAHWARLPIDEETKEVLYYCVDMIDNEVRDILRDDVYKKAVEKAFEKLEKSGQSTTTSHVDDKNAEEEIHQNEQAEEEKDIQEDTTNLENEGENNL